jgi:hypothetical protein
MLITIIVNSLIFANYVTVYAQDALEHLKINVLNVLMDTISKIVAAYSCVHLT